MTYYSKISLVDFNDYLRGVSLGFSDSEIRRLSEFGLDSGDSTCVRIGDLDILKYDDEWYYIYNRSSRVVYRCDQFEGLLKCLDFLYEVL